MAVLTGLSWQIVLGRFRVYESHRRVSVIQLLTRLLLGDAVAAAGLASVLFTIGVDAPPMSPLALTAGMFLLATGRSADATSWAFPNGSSST
jgi:hypothetical protein